MVSDSATPISAGPICAGPMLDDAAFDAIRREMLLHEAKWDAQIGDVSTLAGFPLILFASEWARLAACAERMTAELLAAEIELLNRPDLQRQIGIPRRLRQLLPKEHDRAPGRATAVRTLRFDFHWTTDGWRVSEVNGDVPGGYAEASAFPALVARHFPGARTAGDPGAVWADAIARASGGRPVALLAAAGYMEDQQIVARLGRDLARRGCVAHLATPGQCVCDAGGVFLQAAGDGVPIGLIVRFYQAEWLAALGRASALRRCLIDRVVPVTNALSACLIESKRFPIVLDSLRTPLPTWRATAMETRDPRDADWRRGNDWLLKPAFGNTGDDVAWRSVVSKKVWRRTALSAVLSPTRWAAQRRFEALPIDSPVGPIYPCVGVYTIDGKAAGIYGRMARRPVVDFEAIDVAVLIKD